MIQSHPQFAVVGHPNKGKSSIVSALALDESVQVSDTPGTTTKKRSFPLSIDGKILYELFDTPGFQRARRVLGWLEAHTVSADKKYEVVERFIHLHKEDKRFNDEVELLEPIMQGAGIIYVVDGSKPYGEEYEAEMEILRWTGQPSMALINHIDESDYSEEWKRALGQYFKMVRTFNPMTATFKEHISILESMAQLKEEWIDVVKGSIVLFEAYHTQMLERTASQLTRLVYDSVHFMDKLYFETEEATSEQKEELEFNYKEKLRQLEVKSQKQIEKIWNHQNLEKEEERHTFEEMDLFSQESASVFGLTRKELIITGATSGAMTGAGIDLLFAGHTLLIGGAIGAIVGGTGAYFGFNELSEVKVLGQTLGKRYLEIGPMKNKNFPYILLGRALYHSMQISNRSHANRSVVAIEMGQEFKEKWLDDTLRKALEKQHKLFRSGNEVSMESLKAYDILLEGVLKNIIER